MKTQRPGNWSICLSGQKRFSYHICYKTQQNIRESNSRQTESIVLRLFLARTQQYASKEECITLLNEVDLRHQGLKEDLKNSKI